MRVIVYGIREVELSLVDEGNPRVAKINATGVVNTGGWSGGELSPWMYVTPPQNGILDLTFSALPPQPGTIVTQAFSDIPAQLSLPLPDWVRGVKVHGATNSKTAELSPSPAAAPPIAEGKVLTSMPLPWPFPWFLEFPLEDVRSLGFENGNA